MPRPANLSKLSVDELIKMRDDISGVLSSKAALLRKELASLGDNIPDGVATIPGLRKGTKLGKVPPKYRGPDGETWAGRGGMPVWMRDAMKGGKTRDDFLIAKPKGAAKKGKRGRPKKKG